MSCQDVNEGTLNAYRRMIYEDERAPAAQQLGFVLHLGDFIYEVVEYPDEVTTRYDRTIYEVARIPDGDKVGNFHIPLTVGTTTSSRGRVGRASRRRARRGPARASRSPPTRHGGNFCHRVARRSADPRSKASLRPR